MDLQTVPPFEVRYEKALYSTMSAARQLKASVNRRKKDGASSIVPTRTDLGMYNNIKENVDWLIKEWPFLKEEKRISTVEKLSSLKRVVNKISVVLGRHTIPYTDAGLTKPE